VRKIPQTLLTKPDAVREASSARVPSSDPLAIRSPDLGETEGKKPSRLQVRLSSPLFVCFYIPFISVINLFLSGMQIGKKKLLLILSFLLGQKWWMTLAALEEKLLAT